MSVEKNEWNELSVIEICPSGKPLQAALDELEKSDGGTLYLKEGFYYLNNTILIPSNVRIIGCGMSTRIQLERWSGCHMFMNKDQEKGNSCISIENIYIDGAMEYQSKPSEIKSLTFACGFFFKNSKNISIRSLFACNIRQTAVHLSQSQSCCVKNLFVNRVGWSGLSSSEASNICASGRISQSGLDVMHSAVHMDGGTGVSLDFQIEDSTGNGIMVDSAFSAMGMVTVKGSATRCKRGVSFSGSAKNQLGQAYVNGNFYSNREIGVMISNAECVVVANSNIYDNKEVGLLFQGRNGGIKNIIIDSNIYNNGVDIEERHNSKYNFVDKSTVFYNKEIIRSKFENKNSKDRSVGKIFVDNGGGVTDVCSEDGSFSGFCSTCGCSAKFINNKSAIRESYGCSICNSSVRHRAQSDAILRCFGRGRVKSLKDLALQDDFRKLKIYEPGIVGPNREYFSGIAGYQTSYFWDDIPLGSNKNNIRNEDLMRLTFDNDYFDLVITSDIMEHVRKPWMAFAEISRILKPGGVHIFSIPALIPMTSKTLYRVDTSSDEDVMIEKEHYHIAGDGGKSLVYTDFGSDIFQKLSNLGMVTFTARINDSHPDISRVIVFVSVKCCSIM